MVVSTLAGVFALMPAIFGNVGYGPGLLVSVVGRVQARNSRDQAFAGATIINK
jgi:hypothetical protein